MMIYLENTIYVDMGFDENTASTGPNPSLEDGSELVTTSVRWGAELVDHVGVSNASACRALPALRLSG